VIPDAAYIRYPRLIEVGSDWMHNIFKRLQQQPKITFEFDGSKRQLQFISTIEGAQCREGDIIPAHRVLLSPFAKSLNVDTRTVVVTQDVSRPAQPQPPPKDMLSPSLQLEMETQLQNFRYKAEFPPSAIWKMVKPSKLCSNLQIYFAPGQPLLLQFVLQRDRLDSRRAATYSTWIAPLSRQPNPHVKMPTGGVSAVTRQMLDLAPRLGSAEQTYQVCTQAIQLAGGSAPLPSITTNARSADDEEKDEEI
jgi:hypothetical protein